MLFKSMLVCFHAQVDKCMFLLLHPWFEFWFLPLLQTSCLKLVQFWNRLIALCRHIGLPGQMAADSGRVALILLHSSWWSILGRFDQSCHLPAKKLVLLPCPLSFLALCPAPHHCTANYSCHYTNHLLNALNDGPSAATNLLQLQNKNEPEEMAHRLS